MAKQKQVAVYGIRAILEAIEAGNNIDKIYLKKDIGGELLSTIMKVIREKNLHHQFVPGEKLRALGAKNHQGVVAEIAPVPYADFQTLLPELLQQEYCSILILDRITDVRNFGAIARSAECAGFDVIVIPNKHSAKINPDAIKTSAGALYHIPVCREQNLKKLIKLLLIKGVEVIAATEKADQNYAQVEYPKLVAVIMGAEDTGIAPDLLKFASQQVAIPIKGKVASLNVSAAASILMYEILRQRERVCL